MKSTPTTLMRDLQEGEVEIKGTVQARGPLLESPVAKAPCVFYALFLNETIGSGRHSDSSMFFEDVNSTSFVVNDGSGVVVINTDELVWNFKEARHVALDGHGSSLSFNQPNFTRKITSALGVQHGKHEDLPSEFHKKLGEDLYRCDDANEMHLKDGDELFIQGYARKLHPTSTETQSLTGSDPEWQIVAGPKKGKWNTGISLSIRSEEV